MERKRQRYRKRALVSDPLTRLHPPTATHACSRAYSGQCSHGRAKKSLEKRKEKKRPWRNFCFLHPAEKTSTTTSSTGTRFLIVNQPPVLPLFLNFSRNFFFYFSIYHGNFQHFKRKALLSSLSTDNPFFSCSSATINNAQDLFTTVPQGSPLPSDKTFSYFFAPEKKIMTTYNMLVCTGLLSV